uniref:Transposase n=1 Tax=Aromatoleum buckelii TaxID=200254 RepID=A0ABX1MYQ9_9RHOO
MPDYRRAWHVGGTRFFTVDALQRVDNDLLILLPNVVRDVLRRHRFAFHGWVVLA